MKGVFAGIPCLSSFFLIFFLVLTMGGLVWECEGDSDTHLEEDEGNLKRRMLLGKISGASESEVERDRESRSRGGAAPRPVPISTSEEEDCKSCIPCGTSHFLQERRPKILDGVETVYGAYPWQVSIEKRGQDTGEKWSHICGGSLISKYHVLTAAHCFRDTLSDYRVLVSLSPISISNLHILLLVSM